MLERLIEIIEKEWGVKYDTLDVDTPLITLSEQIGMDSENCTREECYQMYIDNPTLHLPGLIAIYVIDELGITAKNIHASMTLSEIFALQNLEK